MCVCVGGRTYTDLFCRRTQAVAESGAAPDYCLHMWKTQWQRGNAPQRSKKVDCSMFDLKLNASGVIPHPTFLQLIGILNYARKLQILAN